MGYIVISLLSWLALRFLFLRPLSCPRPLRAVLSCLFFLPFLYYVYLKASCFLILPEPGRPLLVVMGAWCGIVLLAALFAAGGAICLHFAARLRGAPLKRRAPACGLACSLACAALLVFPGMREGASVPAVNSVSVTLPQRCAALDGLRCAVVSDLHLSGLTDPEWLQETLRRTAEVRPDIILLVGDLSDGRPADRRAALAELGKLRAPLGVWAVPGNHEYYVDYEGIMAALPDSIHVLANSHAVIRTSGGEFVLAGVTDKRARSCGREGPDIEKALAGLSAEERRRLPVLLMSHRPHQWQKNAAAGAVLQVCGHTHGGQFIWNRPVLKLFGRPYLHGLFEKNGSLLWVGSGASQWFGCPLRVGVPPEIALLTLHAGA